MMNNYFSHLKVVELATVLAGPATGMFFAENGAQVIKIENKRSGGDPVRQWKVNGEEKSSATSAYYHAVNWNKEVVFADLTLADDRKTVRTYIAEADILLVNFRKGDADKYQLSNDLLRSEFPTLIIGVIEGFPGSSRAAYDAVLQAESGLMSLNGNSDSDALKMPVAFIDLFAAHQLKEGILTALLQRMTTGKGSVVTVSLYNSAIASLANQASSYLNLNIEPRRSGSLHPSIAPYGETFRTADGKQILIAAGTDRQFSSLCMILKLNDLINDPMFSANPSRVKNRNLLADRIASEIIKRYSDELTDALHANDVPCGIVRNVSEVLDDPSAAGIILSQKESDGSISKRVATVAFQIDSN